MPHITIVNYGVGNLRSVKRALQKSGAEVGITCQPKTIRRSDATVLPGVGAFPVAVKNLFPLSTDYGVRFPSVVAQQNIFATQFHPEKSGKTSLTILKNFVENVKR